MDHIPTVRGVISTDQLGVVSLNEHVLFGLPGWQYAPDAKFDHAAAFDQISAQLKLFKDAGGGTIVDTSGITLGRDVNFYAKLSEFTGVHIVAATGFDNQPLSIPGHFYSHAFLYSNVAGPYYWFREIPGSFYPSYGATKEYLMFLFHNELVRGMIVPGMVRTRTRAGIVKAAGSWDQTVQIEELSLRGAALAAKRAGVSVIMTGSVNRAAEQLKMLSEEGLEPDRIVIGHCDDGRAVDPARDREFAGQGYYVAYDHIGWEDSDCPHALADARRVELVKAMVEAGFAERLVLLCSAIGYAIGAYQPKHSFNYFLTDFAPKLRAAGEKEEAIDTILRENPKRILTSTIKAAAYSPPPPYFGGPPPETA